VRFRCEFVVAASYVLHKGEDGDDYLRGAVGAQPSYRSEPVFESAVVGHYPVVGILLGVVPGCWH
jgi:hypothetical protein